MGERVEHFDTIRGTKIVRDITERMRLEADLRRSTEELLEADWRGKAGDLLDISRITSGKIELHKY